MKILVGVDQLRYGDGISIVSLEMATYLQKQGHEVKIVCSKCEIQTDVPVIICKYNSILHQSSIIDVISIIKSEKPDIFTSHYYPMDICGGIGYIFNTKHIMYSHGISPLSIRKGLLSILAFFRAHTGEFIASKLSNNIISISDFQTKELVHAYKVKRTRIVKIYNNVDLIAFMPRAKNKDLMKQLNISINDFVLMCASPAIPRKGHLLLIEMFHKVVQEISNSKLILIGVSLEATNEYEKQVIHMINELGLSDNIILCGIIKNSIVDYYSLCDIYVSATKWESFGLPFVEAMACGKPVIGFDISAISEIIISGFNGFKVSYLDIDKMADYVVQLYLNKKLRAEMEGNCRLFVEENFEKSTQMKKMHDVHLDVF